MTLPLVVTVCVRGGETKKIHVIRVDHCLVKIPVCSRIGGVHLTIALL